MTQDFEFEIPDDLKAEDVAISLNGGVVDVDVKGEELYFMIKKVKQSIDMQAALQRFHEEFIKRFENNYLDLRSHISICLSENLDRYNKEAQEDNSQEDNKQEVKERVINPSELAAISENYDDYVIRIAQKTVKLEPRLTRQIFTTAVSTYTLNPINLGINAPTSEGKTYPVIEVLQYFPDTDIWYIGNMSPKALVRLGGILVDSNNVPIGDKVKQLRKSIALSKKYSPENIKYKEELDTLLETSKTVIDFSGKVLVFLEPPNIKLWDTIKPILSHDKREIEFPFVNTTDRDGIQTKKIVVRGWPSCIFCSAKDESGQKVWPEVQSRFIIASPTMSEDKYHEANKLIADMKGLPKTIKKRKIISDEEINLAKTTVLYIKQEILKTRESGQETVWVPYQGVLGEIYPSNRGTDNRENDRIISLINISAFTNAHNRPRLKIGEEIDIVATLEDLHLALALTQNFNGIPPYKMEFFNDIFYPCYEDQKGRPNTSDDLTKTEDRVGITNKQLSEFYEEVKKRVISTDKVRQQYVDELFNNGIIDRVESNINKKQFIYYPLISKMPIEKLSVQSNLVKDLQFSPMKPYKDYKIPDNWLELQIGGIMKYKLESEEIKFLDEKGTELTPAEFIKYFQKSEKLNQYVATEETLPIPQPSEQDINASSVTEPTEDDDYFKIDAQKFIDAKC